MPQARDPATGRFISTADKVIDDLDTKAVADTINNDAAIIAAKLELAQAAAEYWRSIAPVGDPADDPNSGAYRDSITVEQDGDNVYVVAKDYKAHWIEWGTETMDEFACRARTEEHFNSQP